MSNFGVRMRLTRTFASHPLLPNGTIVTLGDTSQIYPGNLNISQKQTNKNMFSLLIDRLSPRSKVYFQDTRTAVRSIPLQLIQQ